MADLLTINIRRKLENKQTVTPQEIRSLLYVIDQLKTQVTDLKAQVTDATTAALVTGTK